MDTPRTSHPASPTTPGPVAPGPGTPSSSATTTTAPAVCARGLTRAYGRGDAQVHALRGVDVDFASGAFTAIMGPSGSGKSTLMHCLAGLDARTSGSVRIGGTEITGLDDTALTRLRHRPHELSGGQQQRIALARMFLKNPPIIFLDEPTASLDAIATEQIKQSLDEIKQGRTVVIISHSLSQIIDADYTYVMKEGAIAEHGEHDTLYHQDGVYKKIFDAMAKSLNIEKIARTFEDDAEEETHS